MTLFKATSSAIALCAFAAAPAFAAEPLKASVGGYMAAGFGYLKEAGSTKDGSFGVMRDGEIHFKVKGAADNGLTFSAQVELEAFTTTDQIDENFVKVGGKFGEVMIGGNDSAKEHLTVGVLYAPLTKVGYYDDDVMQGLSGGIDGASDSVGIHYFSPNFSGLRLAASWQPNATADGASDTNALSTGGDDVYAIAASYAREFDGLDLALSAAYEKTDRSTNDDTYGFGAQLGWQGLRLAAYVEQNYDESWDYTGGVGYKTGPWTIAGGYARTETAGQDDVDTVSGWVTYALAPGVSATAAAAYATGGAVPAGTNDDGVVAMTYLSLNF